jgi:hypothetical protein
MTLTEWLLGCIAEDEAAAAAVNMSASGEFFDLDSKPLEWIAHFERHTPADVLATCAAHRRIIELCDVVPSYVDAGEAILARDTLIALAAAYSTRPGYNPAWGA